MSKQAGGDCFDPLCAKHPQTDWHKQALDNEKVIQQLGKQLAAERSKVNRCEVVHRHAETIELLRQQLAAERERTETIETCNAINADLVKQLAAERENARQRGERMQQLVSECVALRQQLAAERNIGWNEGREHERKCNEAELAAECEKVRNIGEQLDSYVLTVERMERELAAEREVGHKRGVSVGQHIARLEDQLAAEQVAWGGRIGDKDREIKALQAELAAEREKREQAERDLFNEANVAARNVQLAEQLANKQETIRRLQKSLHDAYEKIDQLTDPEER